MIRVIREAKVPLTILRGITLTKRPTTGRAIIPALTLAVLGAMRCGDGEMLRTDLMSPARLTPPSGSTIKQEKPDTSRELESISFGLTGNQNQTSPQIKDEIAFKINFNLPSRPKGENRLVIHLYDMPYIVHTTDLR